MTSHRPSSSHQSNKPFKSRHASKGSIKEAAAGKISRPTGSRSGPKARSVIDSKINRRNHAKISIANKRKAEKDANRLFIGKQGAPKIGMIVPLCGDLSVKACVDSIFSASSFGASQDMEMSSDYGKGKFARILDVTRQFKQKLQFVELDRGAVANQSDYEYLMSVLDVGKVADFVVFVVSALEEVDRLGFTILTALKSQGLPSPFVMVQHLNKVSPKKSIELKKSLSHFMDIELSRDLKIHNVENDSDMSCLIRSLASSKLNHVHWREKRPYMLVDSCSFDEQSHALKLSGISRGHPFIAERLVHLPDFGDFSLVKIVDETTGTEYFPRDGKQQPLVFENEVEGEQEDNFSQSGLEESIRGNRKAKRVPKGTSAYQANWIVEESDNESQDECDYYSESEDNMMDDESNALGDSHFDEIDDESEIEEEMVEMESHMEDENDQEDDGESDTDELRQREEYLERKREKQLVDDEMKFPDEVDTPMDIPARFKFRKYRGLKSFRNSDWDPYENLPLDYSRIFQFKSFESTMRKIKKYLDQEHYLVSEAVGGTMMTDDDNSFSGVAPGRCISIYVDGLSQEQVSVLMNRSNALTLFGLLPHEEKISVLNMTVARPKFAPGTTEDDIVPLVKNKDEMVIQCGFRRFRQKVVLSEHSNSNLHRAEKFLQPGSTVVATCYGQITYTPAPTLFFLPPECSTMTDNSEDSLFCPYFVGSGSLFSVDPTRIIVKRKILTGIPVRINSSKRKHAAVIKFMFFNCEDVEYFKPIELRTKMGLRGHILGSVGTHGKMSCGFNKAINSMDTVCLHLYKRVFPKYRVYKDLYLNAIQ